MSDPDRTRAYGEYRHPTLVDRLGGWLSVRAATRHADVDGAEIADFGCGYHADFGRSAAERAASTLLVDVSLSPELAEIPGVTAIEGPIERVLPEVADDSLDVVFCISVLEHLREPQEALDNFARVLRPGGTLVVNVPSWRGKAFLELAAFRFGVSPRLEMEDHKLYYDPRDLWPRLVAAGFPPSHIRCGRHKLGLNTLAVCRAPAPGRQPAPQPVG